MVDNRARHANNQKYIIIGNRFDIDIFKDLVLTVDYSYKFRGRLNKVRNHNLHYSNKQGEEKRLLPVTSRIIIGKIIMRRTSIT